MLVGADWNTECADRIPDGQAWKLYEPADPFADVEWFADLIYQCQWDYDERGRRRHRADRRPGDVLWAGGLHDVAAVTGAGWQPTTGHHPADSYGQHGIRRRIDAVRVTGPLVPAMRAHRVHDTEQTPGRLRPSAGDRRVPARRRARVVPGEVRPGALWAPAVRRQQHIHTFCHLS